MKGKRILVLGAGASGNAAACLARRRGAEAEIVSGDVALPRGEFDLAVVSPGVPLVHPWLAELASRGIPFMSELQFGVSHLRSQGWRLLAVTGSKGKSSVVKLVADALGGVPCGNYGFPTSAVEGAAGWAVVEVSSFMMETTSLPADTFEAAAILNLQEDHLDRHGTVERYHELKRKLLSMTLNPIDASRGDFASEGAAGLFEGTYFDNPVLSKNACCAVELMRRAGLSDVSIASAFARFVPLPHRFETVAERRGVRFVDDSKATSIAALMAGVAMCGESPVRLVAGGLAKGDDPAAAIFDLTKRVKKVYLIGHCAEVFSSAWGAHVDCEVCGTLERAVEAAKRDAVFGETVLLSPGAASFDQFENFGRRGEVFAELAKKEG